MILETANLTKNFGGLVAISNVDLSIEAGEVRGIIGPNGSGKSTLFNLISGIYKPEQGSRIVFDGVDITNQEPHVIARQGVARTFQLLRLFQQMTVLDNLLVGHHTHVRYGMRTALVGTMKLWDEEKRLRQEMMELLDFIGLADYADMPSAELSGGQRRLLALGRAMAMRPKLLMLDEPAAGLSPPNVDNLLKTVFALKDRYGLTLVIVEHILKVVMETCNTVTVLEHGEKIAEGPPAQIKDDHRVIEAYLGKEMDDAEVRAFLTSS
ncbi:MAG: ABC transporter ATP-binding protein [Rhodospirillaceae bacterium]|jgi:branched-chain amino acid transport system ATP-binding protein|nr:ABC transporter ATP-binding protein [Rhodospirillaceae bacterium]MBT5243193.1 ABC transporter ATP-binding protein [Rhodospirillaceae bacterium]MBT6243732.1 ABC transporter ATP-binding protein [Rhodospirillaceae bacterium]MBT7942827.1 ABC transporter ATP-binding protein [Alphaproteobacteria bacterium]